MISIARPKINTCWYCERPQSAAAWRNGRAVCPGCDRFMQQGVICIGVHSEISHDVIIDKIYRDGNWCVLSKEEYERRLRTPLPVDRFDYIDRATWLRAGLPKFGKHGASHTNVSEDNRTSASEQLENT